MRMKHSLIWRCIRQRLMFWFNCILHNYLKVGLLNVRCRWRLWWHRCVFSFSRYLTRNSCLENQCSISTMVNFQHLNWGANSLLYLPFLPLFFQLSVKRLLWRNVGSENRFQGRCELNIEQYRTQLSSNNKMNWNKVKWNQLAKITLNCQYRWLRDYFHPGVAGVQDVPITGGGSLRTNGFWYDLTLGFVCLSFTTKMGRNGPHLNCR